MTQVPRPPKKPTSAPSMPGSTEQDQEARQATEPIDMHARRKIAMLREYGYVQRESGLYAIHEGKGDEADTYTLIARMKADVTTKRNIFTVPERITEKPKESGVVLACAFSPLHAKESQESQTIEIHRADMLARQPKFFEQIQVAKPPHKRKQADFIDALESLGMTAPIESRYNATGMVKVNEELVFLQPGAGALTQHGIDEQYRVQFPMAVASRLTSIQYGWQRTSTEQEAIADYQTLLRILGIAPGSIGYGDVLLGLTAFTPLSQVCETGGVWAIVYGLTGSKKSASTRVLLQAFARDFHGRQETSTVNLREGASTSYAIEQVLYYLSGMLAHLDDGLKGNNVAQKEVEKFYKMLSVIGGHAVTKQGGKRGVWGQGEGGFGIEPYPRGSGIYTVETLPASESHASDLARYIVVSLDGVECVDSALLTELQSQEAAESMNRAMASYIQWLFPHMQNLMAGIAAREETYREQAVHSRTPTSYAKVETGIAALLQYGVSIGAHSEQDATRMIEESRARLVHVALRQKSMMGIDEQSAQANDIVNIFYELLRKALREHKLYASDSALRAVQDYSSEGDTNTVVGYRPQPALFLTSTDDDISGSRHDEQPDVYGWKWNEHARVYEPGPGALEAGVLKWEVGEPTTLHMYAATFKEVVYPTLKKIADSQDIPLPGLNDMLSKLKAQNKLARIESTNLHGRNSRQAGVYILDMNVTEQDPTPDATDPPTSVRQDTKQDASETETAHQEADSMALARNLLDELAFMNCSLRIRKEDAQYAIGVPPEWTDKQFDALKERVLALDKELRQLLSVTNVAQTVTEHNENVSPAESRKDYSRANIYVDMAVGRAILATGTAVDFTPNCSLAQLVKAIQPTSQTTVLYLCGDMPNEYAAWLTSDSGIWQDHTTAKRGIYLDKEKDTDHVARFMHRVTRKEIHVRTMASWFGDATYSVEEAHTAMALLTQYLQHSFSERATPYATPAGTFQQLWTAENRIHGRKFDVLPKDIRGLVHGSSGQGRIELLTPSTLEKMAELHYYDGIFTYSALTWGMPTDVATHDNENIYAGKTPARYRIRYTVPNDWQHIGLFMTPKQLVTGNETDNEAWCYPGENYPGKTFETCADGAEMDVLIEQYAPPLDLPANPTKEQIKKAKDLAYRTGISLAFPAWKIEILERIVYTVDSAKKPLDSITKKLADMRDVVEADARQDNTRQALYKLVRGAIRNILLHGIGSFHRMERDSTYILRSSEPAPDGYTNVRLLDNGMMVYTVPGKTEAYTQQFEHPEWAQLIWARCRARMTKWALSLARETIIAIRTDAIATTSAQPQWDGNTARGTLRKKWEIKRPLKAPHDFDSLDKLVHKYAKGEN